MRLLIIVYLDVIVRRLYPGNVGRLHHDDPPARLDRHAFKRFSRRLHLGQHRFLSFGSWRALTMLDLLKSATQSRLEALAVEGF